MTESANAAPDAAARDLAQAVWPAVVAWVESHRRMGAMAKLRAVEPLVRQWAALLSDDDRLMFPREPKDGQADTTDPPSDAMDLLTTPQVAKRLRRSRQHVARLCRSGQLDHTKAGRNYLISAAALDDYQRQTKCSDK